MIIRKYFDPIEDKTTKSIFLAGPTYRDRTKQLTKSWRIEAIQYLTSSGFNGIVYSPEFNTIDEHQDINLDKTAVMEWEHKAMDAATVILYWIPRDDELKGLTTNIEFGLFYNTNKQVIGFPNYAQNVRYIEFCCKNKNIKTFNELVDTCNEAINQANELINKDRVLFSSKGNFAVIKEHKEHSYFYFERLGVDSVAFIMKDQKYIYLTDERKPPMDNRTNYPVFMTTAFGGSIDKKHLQAFNKAEDITEQINILTDIVKQEVLEEAGYEVDTSRIQYIEQCFVSTQSNQLCHLFLVDIEGAAFTGSQPENEMEAEMTIKRFPLDRKDILINAIRDWKAITILAKARLL